MNKCANNNHTDSETSKSADEETGSDEPIQQNSSKIVKSSSRLIIMLDSENTAKSLEYIKQKLVQNNVYVALQTAKYNYNSTQMKHGATKKKMDKNVRGGDKEVMAPGSPQAIATDTYLNFGKFTLDWLKSNYCNSFNSNDDTYSK